MESPTHDFEFRAPSIEELQPLFPAYDILGFIAQGGMGAVYLANQTSLDRPVAIKILPRQFGADPQFRTSFEAEAKAMARLNHPNLIGVYDFGEADGFLFIIMEMVEGKSLFHSAYGKVIEQKEAARIVAAICHGLASAHSHGILHRDIKPSNILLGPGAVPKIGDFGLARPVSEEHNPDEIVFGTPGYSAPEVINHPEAVDQRADIFSVGILLYELLTGQIPGTPYQPPSRLARCDPGLDSIVRRATHPSPEMRYKDAAEIAKDLEGILKKLEGGVLRRPTGAVATAGASPIATTAVRPVLSPRKSKTGPVLIVLLLLGIAAVGALIAVNSGKNDTPAVQPSEEDPDPKPKPKPDRKPKPKPKPKPRMVDDGSSRDKPRDKKPKPTDPEPPKPAPKVTESTTQALARLQANLKKGDFAEMPAGTAQRGDSHFLMVKEFLTWSQALHFAEDHGAQLAVLASPDDLAWATSQFKATSLLWLGLSDSGTEAKWHWVTGATANKELWAPGQPDDTTSTDDGEDFAALLPGVNQIDDLPASRQLPFLLQWSTKGANPGSLAKQLARTGEALKAKRTPIFPAGTRNISGSRFLYVPHTGSWDQASALATAAGGHLAVPSSQAEASWMMDSLRASLGEGESCWVGGRQTGTANPKWTFVTGEKFDFVEWAAQQPDEIETPQPCLQIWRSGQDGGAFGYDNAAATNESTAAFLLEWSAPSRRNMPTEDEMNAPDTPEAWLIALRQKTAGVEKAKYQRFKRRWDKNVEDFTEDIQSEVDSSRRQEMRALENLAEEFAKSIEDQGRIPEEVSPVAKRFIGDLHEDALEKQNEIWEDYKFDFEQALERYLEAVSDQAKRLTRVGDASGAGYLEREAKATSDDNERFHAILNGGFPVVPAEDAGEGDDEGED